jgi:hypothetical protein
MKTGIGIKLEPIPDSRLVTMNASNIRSPWARFAFFGLSVFWAAAGWFVLLQGGFHKTYKYTGDTTFVTGASAVFMAGVLLLLASIAAGILLQSLGARRLTLLAWVLVILVPPCLFLMRD